MRKHSLTSLAASLFAVALGCGGSEVCDDGEDNDGDGFVDCADQDCASCAEDCTDTVDNDGDGRIDCLDDDCDGSCAEDCFDGRDNDGNGDVDCADAACSVTACAEDCADGLDNDGDGNADCADTDCDGGCPEVCDDLRDNDGDGNADCGDGDCVDFSGCEESDCGNGLDDDGDGVADCHDDDCWGRGCEVFVARATGGELVGRRHGRNYLESVYVLSRYTTSVSGSIVTVTSGSRVSHGWTAHSNFAYSPVGTVRHVTASGVWESCGWSVPLAYVGSHTRSDGRFHAAVRSGSLLLTSGCGFTSAGFLPPRLYPRHTWVATTYGAPWYPGVSMVSTTTAMPDYTTFTSGSLSGSHYYRRVVGHSVRWTTWTGTIETGSPFATVLEDGAP